MQLDELYGMMYSDFLLKLTNTNENKTIDFFSTVHQQQNDEIYRVHE